MMVMDESLTPNEVIERARALRGHSAVQTVKVTAALLSWLCSHF